MSPTMKPTSENVFLDARVVPVPVYGCYATLELINEVLSLGEE